MGVRSNNDVNNPITRLDTKEKNKVKREEEVLKDAQGPIYI
jgi:hypothetical protein